jgi:DNA repair exonuclease SbcCD nuclease subunit
MVDLAREERVDLFISTGDLYERASVPEERQFAADWLIRMAEVCPVVIAKGNHDKHLDCQILSRLRSKHQIHVEERAGVVSVGGATVALMSWPERSSLMAELGDREATSNAMRDALQNTLRGLGQLLDNFKGPRVLAGHFMVDGSIASSGQPLLGMPINVGVSDLDLARADLGLMGHIHKQQTFEGAAAMYHYTGSPFRTDFGQLEDKSVILADFWGGRSASVSRVATPCARLTHLEYTWDPAGYFTLNGEQVIPWEMPDLSNSELRLRYHVAPDQREVAAREAAATVDAMRKLGAVLVKVEERLVQTTRARAPEVAAAHGIVAKLGAHWQSIGFDPCDRREALLAKAVLLEEQARAAS